MYKKLKKNKKVPVGASLVLARLQRNYQNKSNNISYSGITLIALILTIIILLILAMVSISYIMRENIIKHAETAVDQYQIDAEKEAIELAYGEYVMDKATGKTDATLTLDGSNNSVQKDEKTGGWTVTFPSGNVYTVDSNGKITGPGPGPVPGPGPGPEPEPPQDNDEELLERYFFGENKTGRPYQEILNEQLEFLPDTEMEEDISKYLSFLMDPNGNSYSDEDGSSYIIYNKDKESEKKGILYEVKMDHRGIYFVPPMEKVYEPKGQEGNTIEYSYDGTDANKKQWLIIGDDQNGTINIISPEALGEGEGLKLGTSNNEDECIKDYNKAIEKINTYCDDLITNNKCSIDGEEYTVTGVRSVGMATDEVEEKIKTDYLKNTFEGKFYDALKKSDIKYADDYIKMLYWNITIVGKEYWIASRLNQLGGSGGGYANIRYVNTGDGLDQDIIISLSGTDYRKAFESTRFVRPIITLKKN